MGTLRTKADLEARFPDNETKSIQPSDFRDLVASLMGVGAEDNDVATIAGSGITRTGAREFTCDPGGDGDYLFLFQGQANIDVRKQVRIGVVKNGDNNSPTFIWDGFFDPGEKNHVIGFQRHGLVAGDTANLEFFVTGGNTLSSIKYAFIGFRLG